MTGSDAAAGATELAAFLGKSCGLAPEEAAILAAHCRIRTPAEGEAVVAEGAPADAIYWIVRGRASVWRDTEGEGRLPLVDLGPGAVIGEIAFLRNEAGATYSATVTAHEGAVTASVAHAALRGDTALREVRVRLVDRFGRVAAERLSATTAFTAEAMSAAIARERRLARHLSVMIMVMAGFVVLSNHRSDIFRALGFLGLSDMEFTTLFYFVFDFALGLLFRFLVRALDEAPELLGLRRSGPGRQALAGIVWSLPPLAAAAGLRALLHPDEPVFSIHALAHGELLMTPAALAILAAYLLLLCPIQEYVTRAGVQAPILNAFGTRRATLGAVVSVAVAAVTFGSMHIAYGVMTVMLTTLVGIYWGIAFVHTRSVLAMTVSHMILGVAAFYWFGLIR